VHKGHQWWVAGTVNASGVRLPASLKKLQQKMSKASTWIGLADHGEE